MTLTAKLACWWRFSSRGSLCLGDLPPPPCGRSMAGLCGVGCGGVWGVGEEALID